jgi:hypothetical protein
VHATARKPVPTLRGAFFLFLFALRSEARRAAASASRLA